MSFAFPKGGLPSQNESPEGTAIFTEAYAVLPAVTHTSIVTSFLPGWYATRLWILARPLTGFAESFAQYAVELSPGGGSNTPEPDSHAQAVIFVVKGTAQLNVGAGQFELREGSFAYLPAGAPWTLWNTSEEDFQFHWIRKRYQAVDSERPPEIMITHESEVPLAPMPGTDKWATQRFLDPLNLSHDFHVNIVTFQPGGRIPFAETHVMEHGLYVLQGTARYLLNKDWVEVGPGDFMWLRAFCPQACIATGNEPFKYLLYKDVNRHVSLELGR